MHDLKYFFVALLAATTALMNGCGGGGAGGGSTGPVPGSPAIIIQPANRSASVGDTVEFTVAATGNAPLAYQWYRNGQAVADATSSAYLIAQASSLNANDKYSVVVSNPVLPSGTASGTATLGVTPAAGINLVAGCIPAVNPPAGIDGTGALAIFVSPVGVIADPDGSVYVADSFGTRRIGSDRKVTTLAQRPYGVTDSAGNIYTYDIYNHTSRTIIKTAPDGSATVFAGNQAEFISRIPVDGTGAEARFSDISDLAIDTSGNLYVSEVANVIRKITPAGVVTTLAGKAYEIGSADGSGAAARFRAPGPLTADAAGNVYVVDFGVLRKITPAGVVTTLAGMPGVFDSKDGVGPAAGFYDPADVVVDARGNLYVAETDGVRKVTPEGMVTMFAGKAGSVGYADGAGPEAQFNYPRGIAIDPSGNLFVADSGNHVVRKIAPDGTVTTYAGRVPQTAYDTCTGSTDGDPWSARFNRPGSVAADAAGNAYIADTKNHTVRKIDTNGTVTTLAGVTGTPGYIDGPASSARFNHPVDLSLDAAGNVYVFDSYNRVLRKISPTGTVDTVPGTLATLGLYIESFANDAAGNIYGCDTYIHKILPDGSNTTVAPIYGAGCRKIAVDAEGTVYVAHVKTYYPVGQSRWAGYAAISKVSRDGVVTPIIDRPGTTNPLEEPTGLAVDQSGNIYVTDAGRHAVLKITPSGSVTSLAGRPTLTFPGGSGATVGTKLGPFPGSFTLPVGAALSGSGSDSKLLLLDMDAVLSIALRP